VLTLDETRAGIASNEFGSINFNFVTGGGFQTIREALQAPANFGSGGTIPRPVVFLPPVPSLTPAALSEADVVLLGYAGPSEGEAAALGDFLAGGGGLLYFGNWAAEGFAEVVLGVVPGPDGSSRAWVADPFSPLVDGPFGVFDATEPSPLWLMWNLSMAGVGPYGHPVLVNDLGGTFGASFALGLGRAVLFTDEEFLMSPPAVAYIAAPNLAPRNVTLFLNSFAYVVPDEQATIPEPTLVLLLGTGLAGLGAWRKRR
jgi:hypothetical protein